MINLNGKIICYLDESGSDSDGGRSAESTSSYSSLSDFVSELASSDLSPSATINLAQNRRSSHHHHHRQHQEVEYERKSSPEYTPSEDRNVTSLCSSLDLSSVYHPPSSLQLPVDLSQKRKASLSGSASGSDSESSPSSGDEAGASTSRRSSAEKSKRRESSEAAAAETGVVPEMKAGRQTSFGSGSILGQLATQAKELVKETKRQSSQEGIMSQVDKVRTFSELL